MLTFLCTLLIILHASSSLVCNNCNVECDEPTDETCLEPGEDQDVSCLTETFTDVHNNTLHQRKCVLYEKNTKFECPRQPGFTTISCVTCNNDLCNKAPSGGGRNSTVSNSGATTTSSNSTS